jgi:hypothetical protein
VFKNYWAARKLSARERAMRPFLVANKGRIGFVCTHASFFQIRFIIGSWPESFSDG